MGRDRFSVLWLRHEGKATWPAGCWLHADGPGIFHSWRRISKRSCSWSLKLRGSGLWLGTLQAGAELMHLVSTCIMCLLATVMTVHTTECRFTSHLEVGQIPGVPWLCRQPQCLVGVRQRLFRAILSVGLHVSLGPLTPVQTYLVANKSNKRLSL